MTADLHLSVGAAQVIKLAVRAPAHQVSRAVHPAAVRGEGVGEVPLRGEGGPGVVAAGDAGSRQVQLTHRAYDHRPQSAVEDVSLCAVDGAADGCAGVTGGSDRMRGVGGVFARAVQVVDHTDHRVRVQLLDQVRCQRLTGEVHRPGAGRYRTGCEQFPGDRRDRVDQRHVLVPAWMCDQVQRVVGHQMGCPADRQRGEDLEDRQVEGHRCRSQRVRQLFVREHPARPGQHRHDLGVLDHHSLRATRGSRGVDHVRHIRAAPGRWNPVRAAPVRKVLGRPQNQGDSRVLDHEVDTLIRISRVHGHVTGAGLQYAQQRDHQVHRPRQQHAHHVTGPHARAPQAPRQPVRPLLKLPERQRLTRAPHRHTRTAKTVNHPLNELLHPTGHPACQWRTRRQRSHPLPLPHRPHIHLGDSQGGAVGQSLDRRDEPVRDELCGGALEQVGVEEQVPGDSAVAFLRLDDQVVGGGAERNGSRAHLQAGQFVTRRRPVDRQQHLEQRAAVALGACFAEQFLQWHARMCADVVHPCPGRVQGLGECGVRIRAQTERQRVDEIADDLRRVRVVAAGDRNAEGHVVPVRELDEDDGQGRREDGERGGRRIPSRAGQRFLRKVQRDRVASEGLPRGTGPVGRQAGRRSAFQVGPPELRVARRRFALPGCCFGVLDGCGRQGFGAGGAQEFNVSAGDLAEHDVQGPAVGDGVMQAHDDDVVFGPGAHERDVPEWAGGEVEGPPGLGIDHRCPVGGVGP
ncbi:hypothetical protein SALBM217S_09585 [Streptomyces griseoloalbus]